jgi:hypothetical protein
MGAPGRSGLGLCALRTDIAFPTAKYLSCVVALAYAYQRMEPEKLPPSYTVPPFRLKFKWAYLVAEVVAAALAIVLFLFPNLAGLQSYPWVRIIVIAVMVLVIVVSPMLPWLKETGITLYGRAVEYPSLHQRARQDSEALHVLRLGAIELLSSTVSYPSDEDDSPSDVPSEIIASFQALKGDVFALGYAALAELTFRVLRANLDDKDRVVVAIEDTEAVLRRGDGLIIWDTEDRSERGFFEVSDQLGTECHAIERTIFPEGRLWKGLIVQRGAMDIVTHKTAILVVRRATNE